MRPSPRLQKPKAAKRIPHLKKNKKRIGRMDKRKTRKVPPYVDAQMIIISPASLPLKKGGKKRNKTYLYTQYFCFESTSKNKKSCQDHFLLAQLLHKNVQSFT